MLREYLYVDITRVRSLLAQLDKGVVEQAVESRTGTARGGIKATVVGIGAERSSDHTDSVQESRSLHELLYSVFEEIADATGLIRDLADNDLVPERWRSSELHLDLAEGELLRVFLPVLVVDAAFLTVRLKRFVNTNSALSALGASTVDAKIQELRETFDLETEQLVGSLTVPRDQRRKAEAQLRKERNRQFETAQAEIKKHAAVDNEPIERVARFFEAYLPSDTIDVRFIADPEGAPELSFAGSLLGRDEYIQREREGLYARYGSLLEGWTLVLQIARVPAEEAGARARGRDFSSIQLADDDVINRSKVLQSAVHLTEMMEARGVAEGALWPTISAIPLAIYRSVPRGDSV